MPGKNNLFNIGQLGVNTTTSSHHAEEGTLASCQNALPDIRGEAGGLSKRDGLVAINSTTAGGSVTGALQVSLPAVNTRTIWVGANAAGNWRTSTNAFSTIGTSSSIQAVVSNTKVAVGTNPFEAFLGFGGRVAWNTKVLIYPSNTYTQYNGAGHEAPPLRLWDGTLDREIGRIPPNLVIGASTNSYVIFDMLLDGNWVYFSCFDGGSYDDFAGRVFVMDLDTYSITQVGEAFGSAAGEKDGGVPTALAMMNGWLWAGTGFGVSGAGGEAYVYRIRPTLDSTWTLDATLSANESVTSLCQYRGLMYAGTMIDSAAVARLLVRSAAGSWSASTTTGGAPGSVGSGWTALTVFEDNLYAGRRHSDGASSATSIQKFDGSSWSSVKTLTAASATPLQALGSLVHNGQIAFACNVVDDATFTSGQISHSTDGTTWTDLSGGSATVVNGRMGVVIT